MLEEKNLLVNAGDVRHVGSIPGSGRSPGGGHGNPLQYSGLENPMDRGTWGAIVHRVVKSWTQLKQLSMHEPGLANENLCDWFRFGCLTRAGQCGFALGLLLEKEALSGV